MLQTVLYKHQQPGLPRLTREQRWLMGQDPPLVDSVIGAAGQLAGAGIVHTLDVVTIGAQG